MTRSTASRRARNSDSVMTGGRRRPESRPSRRRWRLASSRVDPRTGWTSRRARRRSGRAARARRCSAGRPGRPGRRPARCRAGGACGGGGWACPRRRLGAVICRAALPFAAAAPAAAVAARLCPLPCPPAPRRRCLLRCRHPGRASGHPAPAPAALAVRLTVVVLGLLAVPAGPVIAGSRRLAATAAGVPGLSLGRRLEDHLGRLERRGRGTTGARVHRDPAGLRPGRFRRAGRPRRPRRFRRRPGWLPGSRNVWPTARPPRDGGCRLGAGRRRIRGCRVRRGRLGTGRATGRLAASLGRRGLVSPASLAGGRASGPLLYLSLARRAPLRSSPLGSDCSARSRASG
jgi:hypothetical protein